MTRTLTLAVLMLAGCGQITQTQVATAEGEARTYAKANYPDYQIVNLECKDWDSDNDGYVRCNLSLRNEQGTDTPSIECAYGAMLVMGASGCQQPKAMRK